MSAHSPSSPASSSGKSSAPSLYFERFVPVANSSTVAGTGTLERVLVGADCYDLQDLSMLD